MCDLHKSLLVFLTSSFLVRLLSVSSLNAAVISSCISTRHIWPLSLSVRLWFWFLSGPSGLFPAATVNLLPFRNVDSAAGSFGDGGWTNSHHIFTSLYLHRSTNPHVWHTKPFIFIQLFMHAVIDMINSYTDMQTVSISQKIVEIL